MTGRTLLAFSILISAYAAAAVHLGPQDPYSRGLLIAAAAAWIAVLGLRKREMATAADRGAHIRRGGWAWVAIPAAAWIVSALVTDSTASPGFRAWTQFAWTITIGAAVYRGSPWIRGVVRDYCRGVSGRG